MNLASVITHTIAIEVLSNHSVMRFQTVDAMAVRPPLVFLYLSCRTSRRGVCAVAQRPLHSRLFLYILVTLRANLRSEVRLRMPSGAGQAASLDFVTWFTALIR